MITFMMIVSFCLSVAPDNVCLNDVYPKWEYVSLDNYAKMQPVEKFGWLYKNTTQTDTDLKDDLGRRLSKPVEKDPFQEFEITITLRGAITLYNNDGTLRGYRAETAEEAVTPLFMTVTRAYAKVFANNHELPRLDDFYYENTHAEYALITIEAAIYGTVYRIKDGDNIHTGETLSTNYRIYPEKDEKIEDFQKRVDDEVDTIKRSGGILTAVVKRAGYGKANNRNYNLKCLSWSCR